MTVYSPNLNIPHLDANSAQPEVPVDNAIDALDTKITGKVVCAFGASNTLTLTQDQQAAGSIFSLSTVSPSPTGAVTLNFAAFGMGLFCANNATGFTATLQISGQPLPAPTLLAGAVGTFYCDGVNVVAVSFSSGGSTGITASLSATETLAAGDLVNVWGSGGAAKMRKANATDATKPATGFVLSAILSGASGVFHGGAQINTGVSGLTPGSVYYLDTAGGGVTAVAPSSSGNIIQEVGVALSATSLAFFPKGSVLL